MLALLRRRWWCGGALLVLRLWWVGRCGEREGDVALVLSLGLGWERFGTEDLGISREAWGVFREEFSADSKVSLFRLAGGK